jgi:cathepsin L
LLVVFVAIAAANSTNSAELKLRQQFGAWKAKYTKTYTSSTTEEKYFAAWSTNLALVTKHNAEADNGVHTFSLAMNHLADLSADEYRQTYLGKKNRDGGSASGTFEPDYSQTAPDSVDWRTKGIVTAVKNQGQCGSCWAFSAVASMEGAYNMANNGTDSCKTTCGPNKSPCCSFSEQEIVDCTAGGADDCSAGGEMHDGMLEIVNHHGGSINTDEQYPYTSGGGTALGKCLAKDATAVKAGFTGYMNVSGNGMPAAPYGNETALMYAIWKTPVISVAIDASEQTFQLYSTGVYSNPACKRRQSQLDHGVSLVGYGGGGSSDATPYWIVKNSWAATWGNDGYIWMTRSGENQCGIATDPQYVVITPPQPTPPPPPTPPTPPPPTPAPGPNCNVTPDARMLCGGKEILNQAACEAAGNCCWSQEPITSIWCYNPAS